MADLNDLISRLPIDDLASQVGASPDDVRAAVSQAVPTLVAGLGVQNDDGLADKLAKHDNDLASGTINLNEVDTADGQKIVNNLFGEESDNVAQALSGAVPAAGVDQGLVKKLLPILAPIVLSFVMNQFGKSKGGATAGSAAGGGGLGDLLGGMLGGQGGSGGGGMDLGSILGSVLGGGKGGGGGLGDLLGGMLGGKK